MAWGANRSLLTMVVCQLCDAFSAMDRAASSITMPTLAVFATLTTKYRQPTMKGNTMSNIEFGTWETPETVNPYTDTVQAMIDKGPDTAVTVRVKSDDGLKTRNLFAKAANAAGKTARIRVKDEPILDDKGKATGQIRIVFTLVPKHKARRGAKSN